MVAAGGSEVLGPRRHRGRRARAVAHADPAARAGRADLRRVGPATTLEAGVNGREADGTRVRALIVFTVCCPGVPAGGRVRAVHAPADRGRAGRRPRARRAVSRSGDRRWSRPPRPRLGVPKANITLLSDQETPASPATGRSTREQVVKAFAGLAAKAGEDDTVVIVLFGHGTFDGVDGEVQPAGTRHDPGGLCAAAGAAAIEARGVRQHRERERALSSKPCPGPAGSCWRRRAPARRSSRRCSAGRSWMRSRPKPPTPIAMAESRSSKPSSTRGSRSRRSISATGCSRPSTPSSTTTATRKAAWNRARKGRTARSPRVLSLGSTASGGAPADRKLRTLYAERQALERRIESLKLLKAGWTRTSTRRSSRNSRPSSRVKRRQIREAEGKSK